jgi:RNA polymerase sigma-70 factor, ECF subfamily
MPHLPGESSSSEPSDVPPASIDPGGAAGSEYGPITEEQRTLARLVQESGRDVLATLVRTCGDFALAEDAVQDAVLRALETWPRDGVPANPVAWLRLVARRRATDLIRRELARRPKEQAAMDPRFIHSLSDAPDSWTHWPRPQSQAAGTAAYPDLSTTDDGSSMVDDDLLRLVFTCCHPALDNHTKVALALRTLCGLTTEEVARALLVSEATMSKRLTRAKAKIRAANIPYRVPPDHELPDRWQAVLATVYLVFNEGYAATAGPDLYRLNLINEAERLTRVLIRLQPDDPGALGLLALILLHSSRNRARRDTMGDLVLLPNQDRTLWDQQMIHEGVRLVGEALRRTPHRPNRYVVEAAIASCHALAVTYSETDWGAVISWYEVLLTLDPGPVPRLNHAVAVGERDGPSAALELIDQLESQLRNYPLWHATRAIMLSRLDRHKEARVAEEHAAALTISDPLLRHLRR